MQKILDIFQNFDSQEFVKNVFNFILHPEIHGIFLIIKILFIVFSLILLVAIILLLRVSSWFKKRYFEDFTEITTFRPFGASAPFKQWLEVSSRLEAGDEVDWKIAISEADGILGNALAKMGYKGDTTGERLKLLDSSVLPNLSEIWEAHKIRNDIVHNPDYHVAKEEAKRALKAYEQAFRDLELF